MDSKVRSSKTEFFFFVFTHPASPGCRMLRAFLTGWNSRSCVWPSGAPRRRRSVCPHEQMIPVKAEIHCDPTIRQIIIYILSNVEILWEESSEPFSMMVHIIIIMLEYWYYYNWIFFLHCIPFVFVLWLHVNMLILCFHDSNTWAAEQGFCGSVVRFNWRAVVLFRDWVDSGNTPLYLHHGLHDANEGFFPQNALLCHCVFWPIFSNARRLCWCSQEARC